MAVLMLVAACQKHDVPQNAQAIQEKMKIFPDYTSIVVPPNIAPLNFLMREKGDEFAAEYVGADGTRVTAGSGNDGNLQFGLKAWKALLKKNVGKEIALHLYVKRDGKWFEHPYTTIQVAEEPIDDYLSYRLIEPGYELYRQLGLYQRNLTNFDVKTIYENPRKFDEKHSHCINCHNYQNYSTQRMLFHVRAMHGGTIVAQNGKIEKVITKADSILGAAVYPSWHPTKNWLVFSTNKTGQVFHLCDPQKIEVLDYGSDLLFYNADTKEISNIIKTTDDMETFPCWNPAGDKIYYCSAKTFITAEDNDSVRQQKTILNYKRMKYNLMSMAFDEATCTFGEPQLELDCASRGMSASVPRVSPDGKYLLFTLGEFGQFHIWHKSSDLYVKNLQTQEVYPLKAANSADVDSYHSWSSNGRWIAFSSRRDDGSFTRTYITYFDKNGQAHKAFMIPQKDATFNVRLYKSFNVPELTKDAVPYDAKQFKEVIFNSPGSVVKYKEIRPQYK